MDTLLELLQMYREKPGDKVADKSRTIFTKTCCLLAVLLKATSRASVSPTPLVYWFVFSRQCGYRLWDAFGGNTLDVGGCGAERHASGCSGPGNRLCLAEGRIPGNSEEVDSLAWQLSIMGVGSNTRLSIRY